MHGRDATYVFLWEPIFCLIATDRKYTWCNLNTIFTWLNAAAFITLVRIIDAATIQIRPLLDTQRCHNLEIHCGTNQVRLLLKVRHLTE